MSRQHGWQLKGIDVSRKIKFKLDLKKFFVLYHMYFLSQTLVVLSKDFRFKAIHEKPALCRVSQLYTCHAQSQSCDVYKRIFL